VQHDFGSTTLGRRRGFGGEDVRAIERTAGAQPTGERAARDQRVETRWVALGDKGALEGSGLAARARRFRALRRHRLRRQRL
jgi:hypothetical protein